jgi:hypothetical protein
MCNDDNAGPPITADLERPPVYLSVCLLSHLSAQDEAAYRCRCGSVRIWIYMKFFFKEATHILGPLILSLELKCLKRVEASFGT